MIEIKGYFWDLIELGSTICVTTNGIVKSNGELVMGAGIAKQFNQRFPGLALSFGKEVRKQGNVPIFLDGICIDSDRKWNVLFNIMSFPTKHHWKDPSDPELIFSSAQKIQEHTTGKVFTVRPGCGLGGLEWINIKKLLLDAGWNDDRFYIISP